MKRPDWLTSEASKLALVVLLWIAAGYFGGWLAMEMAGGCS